MDITYTADEAATLLGIKPRSVRKFIERGLIKAEKRAGAWFIAADEIERYKRERRGPGNWKGHKQSEATKKKLSDARKGDKNPFKGRKHTPEALAKMSARQSQQPRGADSWAWKGGRVIDAQGYVWIFAPDHPYVVNRYVLEHRLVMEQIIGRYLEPGEDVHHINEIKTDNRPENLELMTHSAHMSYHRTKRPSLPRIRKK